MSGRPVRAVNELFGGWIHRRRGDRNKSDLKTLTKPAAITMEKAASLVETETGAEEEPQR